jgi:putative spermidine/putrescine transport system ATP-binding protein
MTSPLLELRNLSKNYGLIVAVDHVSVSLAAGEFLSLLGPSGSGKTSTLSMIAGLVEPSSGEILLKSKPLNPLPPYRRNIGMVFQNYALFPHMTVAKNIAFPLEMRRMPTSEINARVARVLSLVGLENYGPRLPSQLSGGQQQRIALARAIVFEPPLLLMDEPLGALDKKLREQMQLEIKQLHRKLGMSIVYVTHDQEEALTMSDRIAVFNNGSIEQIGAPSELYEEPATRFVANFIGETNLFPGTVTNVAEGCCLIAAGRLRLRARHRSRIKQGQTVLVAVRPERTVLSGPNSLAENMENVVTGDVSELIYLGKSRKYVIRAGAAQITALQQITSSGDATFNIGDAVAVHWKATDATTIADLVPNVAALTPVTLSESSASLDGSLVTECGDIEPPSR